MILEDRVLVRSVSIHNFRCVREATIRFGPFTSMVGPNGVGKSTVLRALELFYDPSPRISADDFFAGDTSIELRIAIAYFDLPAEARQLFAKYMVGEELTVERVFTEANGRVVSRFHGASLRHPGFRAVRDGLEIKDRGRTARAAYDALRQLEPYHSLPGWTTLAEVSPALARWETDNSAACARESDEGQFFGFSEVGQGYLGRFTRLLYVPAVREAAQDAAESRGSVLSSLMDLVVRSALINKAAYRRLQARSQLLYERLMDPNKLQELGSLGDQLSSTLQLYVPDAGVALEWRPLAAIELPVPTANVRLVEGEYQTAVERTGHGLQRAFIMTILQQLSRVRATPATGQDLSGVPNLLLAIEEPELYQHPSRQRHLSRTLVRLAIDGIPGVAQTTQVVCATHSPLFVSVERIEDLRILRRRAPSDGMPKATSVVSTTLDRLADIIWQADGAPETPYSGATLLPRLKSIMTPWLNEGFFAEVVVLVEGEDDRAAILGTAQVLGVDIDGRGFAVLPCGGKTCLDRPFAIFTELGISTYVVWDGDSGVPEAKPEDNHRLLRLLGQPVTDWPMAVTETYACFQVDLETTMREEIGPELYDACLRSCQQEFAIPKRKHAQKNPTFVARVIEEAMRDGRSSHTLDAIVASIVRLRS